MIFPYFGVPAKWESAAGVIDDHFRTLRNILRVWRVRENVLVKDFVVDTAVLPMVVELPFTPTAAWLLRAQDLTPGALRLWSGLPIQWEQRGSQFFIHEITGLSAATRYTVAIAFVE
jgi:hypothetical protein